MSTIYRRVYINDVLTDLDSTPYLSDPTATFGVKYGAAPNEVVVVPDGTLMSRQSTGVYYYTFTDPADNLTYTYYFEAVYNGHTYHIEGTYNGPSGTEVDSLENLRSYIKRKLGYPTLCIELTDDMIDDAINDATRLFNKYLMKITQAVSQSQVLESGDETNVGSITIDLPAGATEVYYVQMLQPISRQNVAQMTVFEIMYRMVYPPMELGQWYMMKSFYEMYQRIRGTEPDYRYSREENKIYIDAWSGPYDVFYVYATELVFSDLLTGYMRKWETDYLKAAMGYAKQTLGRVRGKFSATIPAPGGALTTDAEDLKAEAKEDLLDVEDKLKRRMRAYYLPVIG